MNVMVISIENTINTGINNIYKGIEQLNLESKEQINEILCPECYEPCKFEMKNYRIKLFDCKNGHEKENIKLEEFVKYQKVDLSKIICDKCNKNKGETFNNEFYICLKCNMKLCPSCKSLHDKTHQIINYEKRNDICMVHKKEFIYYCPKCKNDLCSYCVKERPEHERFLCPSPIDLSYIKKRKKMMNKLRKILDKFNENIKETIRKLKKVMENMELFYNIFNKILYSAENNNTKNKYHQYNKNIVNNLIRDEIENIQFKYENGNNLYRLLYIYNEMEDKNLTIEIGNTGLGQTFIDNNKDKLKVLERVISYNGKIFEDREYELIEFFNIYKNNKNQSNNDSIESPILFGPLGEYKYMLKGINNVTNMSYMFDGCNSLSSLPDISKWDTKNVINMSNIFKNCNSLLYLPDISSWDTSNVINMSYMFSGCTSLKSLPEISKWNTSNVTDMKSMFNSCTSLISLPDLSKWDTSEVTNMNSMFRTCISLLTLPDISKWNTTEINDFSFMFYQCKSLSSLPDLSGCKQVCSRKNVFTGCSKELKIPYHFECEY